MTDSEKFRAYRSNGNLVIELPEENIIFGVENHPEDPIKVIDRDKFLDHIAAHILEFSHGYEDDPVFNKLLDALASDAAESDAGVEIPEYSGND